MTTVVERSMRSAWHYASASWTLASRGAGLVSFGVWVAATATVVLFFPLERAWIADAKFADASNQMMGGLPSGGVSGSTLFTGQ